jgi:hypothetical protein
MAPIGRVLIVVALFASACSHSTAYRDDVQRRIVAAGAVIVRSSDVQRTANGESTSWDLDVRVG